MQKRKLTIEEVQELVLANRYRVDEKNWFLSRCIDGRYDKKVQGSRFKVQGLEPLAKPGADIGDLMIVFAANREYGLEIEEKKIFETVLKTAGGFKNFRFHTDEHNSNIKYQISKIKNTNEISNIKYLLGCGHFKQAAMDSSAYGLIEEDIKAIGQFLTLAKKKEAKCEVLQGEHLEGAVVVVKGEQWSVAPQLIIVNELLEVFVYQKTLDNKRRKILVKHLLPYVKAPFSVDEEYLYQVLSQTADNQLLETVSRLAKELPVYEVIFKQDGEFEIKQL